MDLLNLNNVAIFTIFGTIAAFWRQIQTYIIRIFTFFIRTDQFLPTNGKSYMVRDRILKEILENSRIIRWGNTFFSAGDEGVIKDDMFVQITVAYKNQESSFFLYKNKIPFLLSYHAGRGISVTYIQGTFPFQQIVAKQLEYVRQEEIDCVTKKLKSERSYKDLGWFFYTNRHAEKRFFEKNGEGNERTSAPSTHSSPETLAGNPLSSSDGSNIKEKYGWNQFNHLGKKTSIIGKTYEEYEECLNHKPSFARTDYYWSPAMKELKDELEFWLESYSWHKERQLQWKRGALLYGKPGTGKSKGVYECAQTFNIPLHIIDLSGMSSETFMDIMKQRTGIILIEDVDCIFEGRENVENRDSFVKAVSMQTVLNALSGADAYRDAFVIMTANHPEKLDPALLRPDRLDVHIEVGNLDKEGRIFIGNNLLKGYPDDIQELAEKYQEVTAAEYQNICYQRARELFQKKRKESKEKPVLDVLVETVKEIGKN